MPRQPLEELNGFGPGSRDGSDVVRRVQCYAALPVSRGRELNNSFITPVFARGGNWLCGPITRRTIGCFLFSAVLSVLFSINGGDGDGDGGGGGGGDGGVFF